MCGEIAEFYSLIRYNEERLQEDNYDILQTLTEADSTGSIINELLGNRTNPSSAIPVARAPPGSEM